MKESCMECTGAGQDFYGYPCKICRGTGEVKVARQDPFEECAAYVYKSLKSGTMKVWTWIKKQFN